MRNSRRFLTYGFLGTVALLFVIATQFSDLYIDWLWFKELGYGTVFTTVLSTKVILAVLATVLTAGFVFWNIWIAKESLYDLPPEALEYPYDQLIKPRYVFWLSLAASLGLGWLIGMSFSSHWITILQFKEQVPFGQIDPIFGKDLAFYIFSLPFFNLIYQTLATIIFLTMLGIGALYFFTGSVGSSVTGNFNIHPKAYSHLSRLFAGFVFLKAWNYLLSTYKLLYSNRGVAFGASYTDLHAQLPALKIMFVIAVIVGLILLYNSFKPNLKLAGTSIGIWIAASILVGSIYPGLVQQFVVSPNELSRETPYIEYNIKYTRDAYGLNNVVEKEFPAEANLNWDVLDANDNTIKNIRLWDSQPLLDTYQQIQAIRAYYSFDKIDVDRYEIDGELRQILLSVREMDHSRLDPQAQTWIGMHMQYTHGYGVVASPAADVTPGGLPELQLKDVPPQTDIKELQIDRPEIYYGRKNASYAIVNTKEPEFNYPMGDANVYSFYEGTGGVPIGNNLTRGAFALYFNDYRFLFNSDITNESRVIFDRTIYERVNKIAPMLIYDQNAYIVIDDGKLYWIMDAYTTSGYYPYSEPRRFGGRSVNYIRNSVKVVIDAYNGDVSYYVFDEEDPIVQTYSNMFPGLFKPADEMPESLRKHVRYPENLFDLQADLYGSYHMQDPRVFYQKEDIWIQANEIYAGERVPMESYYIIMQLPEEDEPEFILMRPYTPRERQNMIGWMGARSDGENYGELVVYKMPKHKTVYGPMQIEAFIDQDAEISQQLTLWSSRGSSVFRGNLMVFPIGDSLLYVEPLYLQATGNALPELRRVIASYEGKVVMAETLDEALEKLFGPRDDVPAVPVEPGIDDRLPVTDMLFKELLEEAQDLYDRADRAIRAGNWSEYGRLITQLGIVLAELAEFTEPLENSVSE